MENLENLIEMTISSQEFINNGWKLVKKYRNNNNNYYALIKCINCGDEKLVNYYNFINGKQRKCPKCRYYDLIGQTIGSCLILDVDHIDYITRESGKKTEYRVYYKVQCVNCQRISVKLYNKTNWKSYKGCNYCISDFNSKALNKKQSYYKLNAKNRNLSWELTSQEFYTLVTQPCKYCGQISNIEKEEFNGIDRIDSSKGYTIDNCVPCCTQCNTMKLDYTLEDFTNHIKRIYNHLINEGSTTIENTPKGVSE